jgi:hypothetical protein
MTEHTTVRELIESFEYDRRCFLHAGLYSAAQKTLDLIRDIQRFNADDWTLREFRTRLEQERQIAIRSGKLDVARRVVAIAKEIAMQIDMHNWVDIAALVFRRFKPTKFRMLAPNPNRDPFEENEITTTFLN